MARGHHDALVDVGVLTHVYLPWLMASDDGVDMEALSQHYSLSPTCRVGQGDGGVYHRQDAVLRFCAAVGQGYEQRGQRVLVDEVVHRRVVVPQQLLHAVGPGPQLLLVRLGELLPHFGPIGEGRIHNDDAGVFGGFQCVFQFRGVVVQLHPAGSDFVVTQVHLIGAWHDGLLPQQLQGARRHLCRVAGLGAVGHRVEAYPAVADILVAGGELGRRQLEGHRVDVQPP